MNWLSQMLMQEVRPQCCINTPKSRRAKPVITHHIGNERKKQKLAESLKPHLQGHWLSVRELLPLLGRSNESGVRESVQKLVDRGLVLRRNRDRMGSAGREVIEYTWR